MAGRLIGRDAEMAQLYGALSLAAQGEPQLVVVAGDAGIGKTSLVSDLISRAEERGFATAIGHCLDIEAAMSFAPAVEALRTLLSDGCDFDGRPHARRMRAMLDPGAPEPDQIRMLDDIRLTLLEAAVDRPLLLVVEDMHWADRSTQDLTTALARTAHGRLLLVLTVRSDELHRRHPFRTALAELSRLDTARRVDVRALHREDVAELVRDVTGSDGNAESVRLIHARSEGNPLYAEELIDADQDALPEHLADLLLARVSKLSGEGRKLVRTASVDGTRVDTRLLADVVDVDQARLEECLREAVDLHVLRQVGGGLAFRHGLMREAVYDDLLPHERARLHGAVASAMQRRVDAFDHEAPLSDLSRTAFHWRSAGDLPRALAASVRAGLAARRYGAHEGLTHFQYALSVFDQVPAAEQHTGFPRTMLLVLAAETAREVLDYDTWRRLIREAVALLGPDTAPLLASRVYSAFARSYAEADEEMDEAEVVRRAVELAGEEPSEELARAETCRAQFYFRREHFASSLASSRRAEAVAQAAGCPEVGVLALRISSTSLGHLGRLHDAIKAQRSAVATAEAAGLHGRATFERAGLALGLLSTGAVDEAVALAEEGYADALARGLPTQAAGCGAVSQTVLRWRGRFAEAAARLEELVDLGLEAEYAAWLRADLLLARGAAEEAEPHVRAMMAVESALPGAPEAGSMDAQVTLFTMLNDPRMAASTAVHHLTLLEDSDSVILHTHAAYNGYRVLDLAHPDGGAETLEELSARSLDRARVALSDEWRRSSNGLRLAMAEALARRRAGRPAVDELRCAVQIAEPFGAYTILEPRLLLAEELLAHGERDEGRELLTAVWSEAKAMGAGDHERRAFKLATRARVPLPHGADSSGPLARLTPREREVLDLLAEGATNREIAAALFISEKTASVHVSNLLAKLHAPNRGAAAALVRRLT